jgi:5-methylcytosine-specific restriction endonuclease McrA
MSRHSAKGHRWEKTRRAVLERDGYRCQIPDVHKCSGFATQVDHVVPRRNGGSNHPDNLRAACNAGNQARNRTKPPLDGNLIW